MTSIPYDNHNFLLELKADDEWHEPLYTGAELEVFEPAPLSGCPVCRYGGYLGVVWSSVMTSPIKPDRGLDLVECPSCGTFLARKMSYDGSCRACSTAPARRFREISR